MVTQTVMFLCGCYDFAKIDSRAFILVEDILFGDAFIQEIIIAKGHYGATGVDVL